MFTFTREYLLRTVYKSHLVPARSVNHLPSYQSLLVHIMSLTMLPLTLICSFLLGVVSANNPPCPILGPNFPLPTSLSNAPAITNGLATLQRAFNSAIQSRNSTYGPISPNTTSFSIALFSAETNKSSDPFLWEYNYAAPSRLAPKLGKNQVDADSVYRIGAVTQMFTTYTFLIEAGDGH